MTIFLDTSPLVNANSIRGVGVYTRFLSRELQKLESKDFQLVTNEDPGFEQLAARTKADIIHYPFFDLFFHTLPLRFFRASKPKVVVTIHDVIPLVFPRQYYPGVKGTLRNVLQRVALSHVDAVITDSKASQRDIQRLLQVPESKLHVVYLAGNPEIQKASQPQVTSARKKYTLPEKYALYVGDINYNKNIPELIKAMSLLDKSLHLVCVGKNFRPYPTPEWQRIAQAIDHFQVQNRVHFITELGSEANQSLSAIYTGASCYVQPSLYEGFGLPVLEALQCETPVVCAKNSSLIEVGGEVVEFVGTTAQEIANGVMNVLAMNSRYTTLGWKQQVKKHLEQFTWQQATKRNLHVYNKVLYEDDQISQLQLV